MLRLSNSVVVRVLNLRKSFGKREVLRGINLEVTEGEVFGIVGPNGAGKTTLLRIVAGLLKPSAGEVEVFGFRVPKDVDKIRRFVSYLPEEANLYGRLTGSENMKLFAMTYFGSKNIDEIVRLGVSIAGISEQDLKRKAETYSKGMSRRVAVASTLMVKPRLAILDEPTVGLDVVSARYVREIIKQFAKEFGTTIIFSSHNMFEVSKLCDRVALIHSGRIVAVGSIEQILADAGAGDLEEAFVKLAGGENA
ncbi:MAG: ABC transporter ATP-binding protein [Sulfolobales archaeon]